MGQDLEIKKEENKMLEDEFEKSKGEPVMFKGKIVLLFDTIYLPEKSRLILRFHKTKSKWCQGVCFCDMPHRSTKTRFTVVDKRGHR